jgi:hypothetical protein
MKELSYIINELVTELHTTASDRAALLTMCGRD